MAESTTADEHDDEEHDGMGASGLRAWHAGLARALWPSMPPGATGRGGGGLGGLAVPSVAELGESSGAQHTTRLRGAMSAGRAVRRSGSAAAARGGAPLPLGGVGRSPRRWSAGASGAQRAGAAVATRAFAVQHPHKQGEQPSQWSTVVHGEPAATEHGMQSPPPRAPLPRPPLPPRPPSADSSASREHAARSGCSIYAAVHVESAAGQTACD